MPRVPQTMAGLQWETLRAGALTPVLGAEVQTCSHMEGRKVWGHSPSSSVRQWTMSE